VRRSHRKHVNCYAKELKDVFLRALARLNVVSKGGIRYSKKIRSRSSCRVVSVTSIYAILRLVCLFSTLYLFSSSWLSSVGLDCNSKILLYLCFVNSLSLQGLVLCLKYIALYPLNRFNMYLARVS
jgi:hypothetical protein